MNGKKFFRKIPLIIIVVFICLFFVLKDNFTVESLLDMRPDNPYLAGVFLMILFACKSLSIVFPSAILFVMSGRMYSPIIAILVNTAGLCVCFVLMYAIGRPMGQDKLTELTKKYPRLTKLDRFQNKEGIFFSYIIRMLPIFPMDVVSMLCGALKIKPGKYLLGSLLGSMPMMIGITLIGQSLTEPGSPEFIFACLGTILVIAISILLYYFIIIRSERRKGMQ